ncbi:hypothetical protein LCGC14_2424370, partial [marine sediment metagenome]
MANERDGFNKSVIEVLAKRAAYICSNSACKTLTIGPSPEVVDTFDYIGKAAHITAAARGGPRFNSSMTSEERKSIDNGIFLCSNCAEMVDKNNGADYPVELLQKWKSTHDSWVRDNLNKRKPEHAPPAPTFNVISTNQSGGITAGVVHMRPQPRKLDIWNFSKIQ